MRMDRKLALALAALALTLSGCGGLLGGGGRADMYRFGNLPAADPAAVRSEAARPAMIVYVGATFASAIDGDRILTVTGHQAGYVAGARWISPASDLFDVATVRAFEQRAPTARLVRLRGSPVPEYALGIDVFRFEADYAAGAEVPPEIVIEARARLVRWSDRRLVGEWQVATREPAQENRVATIVDAFDRGTNTVVTRIADHVQQTLASNPSLAMGDASRR